MRLNNKIKTGTIVIVLLFIALKGYAQNEVSNDTSSRKKITVVKNNYFYLDNRMNEKTLHLQLVQKNNKKINQLVEESKSTKKFQYVMGFMAVPFAGVAGYLFYRSSHSRVVGISNGQIGSRSNGNFMFLGVLCSVLTVACPLSTLHYKKQRAKYNLQAIKIYNESW